MQHPELSRVGTHNRIKQSLARACAMSNGEQGDGKQMKRTHGREPVLRVGPLGIGTV